MPWRHSYFQQAIKLIDSMIPTPVPAQDEWTPGEKANLEDFVTLATPLPDDDADTHNDHAAQGTDSSCTYGSTATSSSGDAREAGSSLESSPYPRSQQDTPPSDSPQSGSGTSSTATRVEADACCDICGYRPKGHPQWFKGSMAKHKKLQHSAAPPRIYKCPFPGCTSQYKNRPDNLRQHQLEKGHFVEGEEVVGKRPSKRRKR
jgi:hypothetical protein